MYLNQIIAWDWWGRSSIKQNWDPSLIYVLILKMKINWTYHLKITTARINLFCNGDNIHALLMLVNYSSTLNIPKFHQIKQLFLPKLHMKSSKININSSKILLSYKLILACAYVLNDLLFWLLSALIVVLLLTAARMSEILLKLEKFKSLMLGAFFLLCLF